MIGEIKMVRLASRTISYINLLEGGCEASPHAYEKDYFYLMALVYGENMTL